ncbi:MAG: S8 family serine peptidase [Candidatus Poseidoniia archaeon]|jgi:subtilisin family serine protease|nr:S8 family serine peptidase [Candidatus Poseidoniia archaeon]MDP6533827.1 S8 family serine peptidase [Candidatus Poseidoniia archaeon]MDP6835016.1 S8 family serine peptidase [Candidatus Poseidoniia archaeon]HIH79044.1 S8 family serine peptidase [Candidatus Poseidoniia archaeon]
MGTRVLLLVSLLLLASLPSLAVPPEVGLEPPWWEIYSRDKDRNGISDLLEWKLAQEDRFFSPGEARIFVRYDHHPVDSDVARLEAAGATVTLRAQYLDLLGTTMPRALVPQVAYWEGVVMLDDIGKAEPQMHEAVPTMGVNLAWEMGFDGTGVTVAIVDTGVDGAHVGLDDQDDNPLTDDPKILVYYNAYEDQEYDGRLSEDSGTHGTHVAGITAGTGAGETAPDGTPYIGVAPQANLANVLTCCAGDIEDIIRGIEWTITNQARFDIRVMTSSLGEQQVEFHIDNDGSSAWSQAVNAAVESGLVVTLSAGNEFGAATVAGCNTIDSPGDALLPITVAALDKDLSLAPYSSRGYTSDGRVKPDVAAIGSNIMAPNKGTGTGYTSKSGTSMATPLMAGIVALTLEANPDLTPAEVKETIVAGYSIEREILDDSDLYTNDCSLLETRPDNEYGYGQADPRTFVEVAGQVDPLLQISWTIPPQYAVVNNTTVEVKSEIYNVSWLTGSADAGGAPIAGGVEVRFGATGWYPATDISSTGDWSSWRIQVPPEAVKGNQTLSARLVVASDRMSAIDSVSVVLLDERAPAPKPNDSPGLPLLVGLAALAAVALRRRD